MKALRILSAALLLSASFVVAADLTPAQKTKLDAKMKELSALSTQAKIVEAVKVNNENPPAEYKEMTQEKWKELTVLSPEVKAFTKNEVGLFLKTLKDSVVTECFVSAANGNKVAFISKTSNWCHKGKPKHDVPMTGKSWIGKVELDESTGLQEIQFSIPVLDAGKPIGSIVVGLNVAKL